MDIQGKHIEIITGRYGRGSQADNIVVDGILGGEQAKERFELYFHWYNLLHELGHGIVFFHQESRLHPVDEEVLVNDFAVAFWQYYGDRESIDKLSMVVSYALAHLKCPVDTGISYIDYAVEKWGREELYNFNNYGWVQFSCVANSLRQGKTLESVLPQMGIKDIKAQPPKTLSYVVLDEDTVPKIIEDAVCVLREWGVMLPDVSVRFDDDPNRHMCNIIDA